MRGSEKRGKDSEGEEEMMDGIRKKVEITSVEGFIGKTIKSIEVLLPTYVGDRNAWCIVFTDGTRTVLEARNPGTSHGEPRFDIDQMEKAPNFFEPGDFAEQVLYEKEEERKNKESIERRDRKRYEELRARFEREVK